MYGKITINLKEMH